MILRLFLHTDGLYHFADSTTPHGSPPHPQSPGVDVPTHGKHHITRQLIDAAQSKGIAVAGVTGRLADKETAREFGVRFVDTHKRGGKGKITRRAARRQPRDWSPGQSR